MIPASAPKIRNRTPATFRFALQSTGFNDFPVLIIAKPANDILVGHLGAQTTSVRLVPVDAVCEDTSASAFLATQPLYKTCDGRFWRYAIIGQIFIAQKTSVAAMEASNLLPRSLPAKRTSCSVAARRAIPHGKPSFTGCDTSSVPWSICSPNSSGTHPKFRTSPATAARL